MRLYALPSLRDIAARIRRERSLFDRSPKVERAIIAGVEHIRVLRDGEWQMVPVLDIYARGDRPLYEMGGMP